MVRCQIGRSDDTVAGTGDDGRIPVAARAIGIVSVVFN